VSGKFGGPRPGKWRWERGSLPAQRDSLNVSGRTEPRPNVAKHIAKDRQLYTKIWLSEAATAIVNAKVKEEKADL